MAIGDIKTFDIVYTGLTLQINAIDMGGGTVRFEIICVEGSADINALYFGDDINDGSNYNLGGSLNMNGTGDWDDGVKLSSPGIGPEGEDKATYLQEGESYVFDRVMSWDSINNLGVRATSTSTAGGSIKGVDDDGEVTECPHTSINDVTVAEEAGNAVFTVSLAEAYLYDVTISYTTADGTAGSSDYTTTGGTITILAGQTSATITVPILDDNNPETTETFVVNLTGATADIPDLAGGPDSVISVAHCIVDGQGVGTITDTDDDTPPPVDTVIATDDTDFACGVEGLVKVTGNVLTNDTDSLAHDLDITHVNGTALLTLDPTPVGTVYEFAITGGTLKIDAETGAFEFTYDNIGNPLPVGGEWEGSFTYTVTDGDDDNDSDDSVHTATVDLCIDAAAASHGYWSGGGHSFADSEGIAGAFGTVAAFSAASFDDYFNLDTPINRTWTIDPPGNPAENPNVTYPDLTFLQAISYNSGQTDETPAVNGDIGDLVREATTAVLNFYDSDGHDAFVAAYEAQFGAFSDASNDQAVLDDLRARVETAIETSDVTAPYMITELANQLHLTHE